MVFRRTFISFLKLLGICSYFAGASVGLAFLCTTNRDYKLDQVAFSLNDYNKHDYYNGFQSPYIRLHKEIPDSKYKNRSETYNDLFNQFYYNSFVKHLRQYATNDIHDELIDSKINVYCQQTYLCRNNELSGGGHYVDYGIFASYYGDNVFDGRPEGDPRSHAYFPFTGCVTFAYISDKYADALIEYYKLAEPESQINDYLDLIFKKPILPIKATKINEDGTTSEYHINVSINNILYSDKRHGYRITELYGTSFALIDLYSYGKKTREWADLAIEMDLKVDPFATKQVLQGLENLEYNLDNTEYEFYKYNYFLKSYELDDSIHQMYLDSFDNNTSNTLFCCLLVFSTILFYALNILFIRKDELLRKAALFSYLVMCLAFGLVVTFTYFYPLWSLAPILLLSGGIVINLFRNKETTGGEESNNYEIQI